jgi:hypothetical protein
MTRSLPLAAAAALLSTSLAGAAAACPSAEPLVADPALLRGLTEWIAAHTAYDASRTRDDPPEILTCGTGETILYEDRETVVESGLRAAYGLLHRRIFLIAPWSPNDPADQARLLHELVHDVQFQSAEWPCPQAAEAEAYRLTAEWMEEQGLEPDFDWFEVYLLARCPDRTHP